MITTLDEFIVAFTEIKNLGWIDTHRNNNTGIGKTLEDLLGILENNLGEPDFGEYELKSSRISTNSMITLFTKSPDPRGANGYLLKKYGYLNDRGRLSLHTTLSSNNFVPITNTGKSLKIIFNENKIHFQSLTEVENLFWTKDTLTKSFNNKYKNKLVFVKAENRILNSKEQFYYKEAYELSGFSSESFLYLLGQGKIYVDIRIGQYSNGKPHDHGTGFRMKEQDLPLLFTQTKQLV